MRKSAVAAQEVAAPAGDGHTHEPAAPAPGNEEPSETSIKKFLEEVFLPLCEEAAKCCRFITSVKVHNDDVLHAGIESCKKFVEIYRKELVKSKAYHGLVGPKNCIPKMHSLETHVPDFARKWRSVGLFGEDVIEAVHKIVNEYQRRWASIHDRKEYMRLVNDDMNLRFEQSVKLKKHKV